MLLGAAPGVGKTFAMLEEGHRLSSAGRDVVVAVVETHGRAATSALVDGLEVIPLATVDHRGIALQELDLDAVLARAPDVALVDELAHTNAPGSRGAKRWQDVEVMLEAGIDVMSTVNIQHIESLNDVVQQITGIVQRETIPDDVLRGASPIELVDLAPQGLRDRLSEGVVYPAARVDAALSNYFRLGNLTALRELALLWLADEVDVALRQYRAAHGIDDNWSARERIVVALTGDSEGETLVRRGARIAARTSGGQLLAVHVSSSDGLAGARPELLAAQRSLTETLGGTFHQLVADRVPAALVDFARGVDATQLVIGVSRRSRLSSLLTGQGIGATIIREAGDIDVHIVSHAKAGGRSLPTLGGALSLRRRIVGFLLAVIGLPIVTLPLALLRTDGSIPSDVLILQLFVVVVALVGGLWPALVSAIGSGLLLDLFFIEPLYTITISEPLHFIALIVFMVVGTLVSVVVDRAARQYRAARRSAAESETLSDLARSVLGGEDPLDALVVSVREVFGLTSVILRDRGAAIHSSTDGALARDTDLETSFAVGDGASLELRGRRLAASDQRILGAFVSQLEAALRQRDLAAETARMRPLAEADRLRTALLAAVGHDLRRPLSSATAAVSSLRSDDVDWSAEDRAELLETAEESLASLSELVTNLLDASRIQAGALAVSLAKAHIDEIVALALDELSIGPGEVELDLAPDLPAVVADGVLLQRVMVNLISNALRFSPVGSAPTITASTFGGSVEVRVVDTGPGVPDDQREEVFVAFQRLGDTDNRTGVGLGLALSKGFVDGMGGRIGLEDTPGGGLTMVVTLPEETRGDGDTADAARSGHGDVTGPPIGETRS